MVTGSITGDTAVNGFSARKCQRLSWRTYQAKLSVLAKEAWIYGVLVMNGGGGIES